MNIEPAAPTTKNPPEQFAGDVWLDPIGLPHEDGHDWAGEMQQLTACGRHPSAMGPRLPHQPGEPAGRREGNRS